MHFSGMCVQHLHMNVVVVVVVVLVACGFDSNN